MSTTGKFQYQLDALLKRRQQERDLVRAEEVGARDIVAIRREQMATISRAINAAENELRDLCMQGAELNTERQSRLSMYLTLQCKELDKVQQQVQRATDAHEQILRDLEILSRNVKVLEKHKESRRTQFIAHWQRIEQKAMDELWLVGARSGDHKVLTGIKE